LSTFLRSRKRGRNLNFWKIRAPSFKKMKLQRGIFIFSCLGLTANCLFKIHFKVLWKFSTMYSLKKSHKFVKSISWPKSTSWSWTPETSIATSFWSASSGTLPRVPRKS
jgi:hypothetical protein